MNEFERVKRFLKIGGKALPTETTLPDAGVLALMEKLIFEEFEEVREAFRQLEKLQGSPNTHEVRETLAHFAKELADLIVVVHNSFAYCGIDGNTVFSQVMDNNDMKLDHAEPNEDGKLVVPPNIKKLLKERIHKEILFTLK